MASSGGSQVPGPVYAESQIRSYKIYYLVSFWLEGTIYGLYFCLFIVALNIMLKRQALDTNASRIFLAGIIMMFGLITFHNSTNVYRMLGAYAAYDPNDPNFAIRFLFDWQRWDAYAFPIIIAVLTWVGDILVIYRCFLIWQRNYYIIILPVILLLASIGTTSVNLWWFRHMTEIPWSVMSRLFKLTYPLNFAQNVLTTSFIAYRIYTQYRVSRAANAGISNKLNFVAIMRIIVESALIYTVQMLLLIIFWYTGSPALVIVQHAITPSIGIVFVLIAIRTHVAKTAMGIRGSRSGSFSIMPTWLSGDDRDRTNHPGGGTGVPNLTSTSEDVQLEFINNHHHHHPRKSFIEFAPPTPGLYDDYYAKV